MNVHVVAVVVNKEDANPWSIECQLRNNIRDLLPIVLAEWCSGDGNGAATYVVVRGPRERRQVDFAVASQSVSKSLRSKRW